MLKDLIDTDQLEASGIGIDNPKDLVTLEKVMAYCEYMKDHEVPKWEKPIPEEFKEFKDIPNMPEFVVEFLSCNKYGLSDLMMAAIDLGIDSLRELIGAKVCLVIRGMTVH